MISFTASQPPMPAMNAKLILLSRFIRGGINPDKIKALIPIFQIII